MKPLAVLPTALVASVLALLVAVGTPIKAQAKNKGVSQSKVLGACKRTAGCWFSTGGKFGGAVGCSPTVCFECSKGKCHQAINGTKPGKGAIIGGVRLPPGTVKPTSGGKGNASNNKPIRHPVNVGVKNPPTKVKTDPTVTWKHGGINQNGGHHR